MADLVCVPENSVITGWDFSTGAVKCLAFNLQGEKLAAVHIKADQWLEKAKNGTAKELHLCQLEGQAMATVRVIAHRLRELGRLNHWVAGGISATHHTAGRIDRDFLPVRRAICWNDETLAEYHARGLLRLGGQEKVQELIGGPWAIRYGLSHLVKDEECLDEADWKRTYKILSHGSLAAGYLTGRFDVCSVSSAASTGLMDLRHDRWCEGMLQALEKEAYRELAWSQLPTIIDQYELVGALSPALAVAADLHPGQDPTHRPLIFPTSDDQQAGLVGGGAVDPGQMAIVLGNSAVVNSSSEQPPAGTDLDCMKLNWGKYLWMRCYNNGAQFLDEILGKYLSQDEWHRIEKDGQAVPPRCQGTTVLPFQAPEPSVGVMKKMVEWLPKKPTRRGVKFRATLEALAYLITLGVRAHEKAGQKIERITISGGIARSDLMCEILATVLGRQLHKLVSDEGPALGAAATALAALETHLRRQKGNSTPFTVGDAVGRMVRFSKVVDPNPAWADTYRQGLAEFEQQLQSART